jgi:hypothetical protein
MNKSAIILSYFDIDNSLNSSGDNVKAKCKMCGDSVSYSKKATSNLVTHLQVCLTQFKVSDMGKSAIGWHKLIAVNRRNLTLTLKQHRILTKESPNYRYHERFTANDLPL